MVTCNALAFFALILLGPPPQQKTTDPWAAWRFLVGEWTGEGSGQPGEGTGSSSFAFDLGGKILVRRNRADYPATKERPAVSHEDLLVIYQASEGPPARAIYFDNEGHVIQYRAQFSEDQKVLTFLSDPAPSTPRFRLTYTKGGNGTLAVKFEIATPAQPDTFSTYAEGVVRRKGPR
jgi:hypothetical protein